MRKTKVTIRTPAKVFEKGQHREVIVEFDPAKPHVLQLRAQGLKTRYPLTVDYLYEHAVRKDVEAERRAKRKKR